MWGYRVCKDAWSTAVETSRLHLFSQPRTVPSLRGQSDQIWVKCRSVHNAPYPTARLATLAFLYVPCMAVPLSMIVSTTGFISSLITSICVDVPHGLCERSALAWQNVQ